jgi:hypothetical protein
MDWSLFKLDKEKYNQYQILTKCFSLNEIKKLYNENNIVEISIDGFFLNNKNLIKFVISNKYYN